MPHMCEGPYNLLASPSQKLLKLHILLRAQHFTTRSVQVNKQLFLQLNEAW